MYVRLLGLNLTGCLVRCECFCVGRVNIRVLNLFGGWCAIVDILFGVWVLGLVARLLL